MLHPVSFMCLEWHFNSSSKLVKKNSHANIKSSMDLYIPSISYTVRGMDTYRIHIYRTEFEKLGALLYNEKKI